MNRTQRFLASVVAVTTALGVIAVNPTAASAAAPCSSMRQIGTTGYVKADGMTAASVKQFYGCGKNYGYIYVWQQFRDSHPAAWEHLWVGVYKRSGGAPVKYASRDNTRIHELYTPAADTADICTHALGGIRGGDWGGWSETSIVC